MLLIETTSICSPSKHTHYALFILVIGERNDTPPPFALIGDKLLCKLQMINQETGYSGTTI